MQMQNSKLTKSAPKVFSGHRGAGLPLSPSLSPLLPPPAYPLHSIHPSPNLSRVLSPSPVLPPPEPKAPSSSLEHPALPSWSACKNAAGAGTLQTSPLSLCVTAVGGRVVISSLAQIRILKLREAGRPAPITPLLGVTSESGRAGSHPSCVTPPKPSEKETRQQDWGGAESA